MRSKQLEQIRQESMEHYGFGPRAMQQTKVCVACGAPADRRQEFCRECGCRLPRETLYDTYRARHSSCPECGTIVSDESRFCPQCGTTINYKEEV